MIMPKDQYGRHPGGYHSRDYILAGIKCACTCCVANKRGECEVPSLIQINARGVCETGLKYMHDSRTPTPAE